MIIEWQNRWETQETDEEILSSLSGEVVKTVTGGKKGDIKMIITFESGKAIKVYHEQDCCESVYIEDEESDDIVGGFVHFAGFVSGEGEQFDGAEDYSYTWSFLKIDTSKGSIWQRWLGESNGYYSETVDVLLGKVVEEDCMKTGNVFVNVEFDLEEIARKIDAIEDMIANGENEQAKEELDKLSYFINSDEFKEYVDNSVRMKLSTNEDKV